MFERHASDRARSGEWQRRAGEFADDSEALQARLHQLNEQQRNGVRSLYSELERRIRGTLERCQSTDARQVERPNYTSGDVGQRVAASTLPSEARPHEPEAGALAQEAMVIQPALN